MRLYNTLTRKKEEFKPLDEKEVRMYSCGPTVYNYFHIGNARPFIIFDTLRRYLEYRGYNVKFVQNFTDIDDKMIKRAQEENITVKELADKFIQEYFVDAKGLGIKEATVHPKATENIDAIIDIISKLEKKGFAYSVDGDVYFSTRRFKEYGKLSHQSLEDLELGSRIDVDERKEDPMDFVLWKAQKPGEPAWDSPWGKGRPGWHIECSAMSMKYLGETFDIHAGGPDLIFPHHENEKAQSEGATGKPFAKYWLHAGYLNINKQKMSKSLGNYMTVRDLRTTFDPAAIRFFMLSAHYRNPINYTVELLQQAASGLERLNNVVYNLRDILNKLPEQEEFTEETTARLKALDEFRERFIAAMDDDFNTADALAVLFELARETNAYLNRPEPVKIVVEKTLAFFMEMGEILGFFADQDNEDNLSAKVNEMIARRQAARKAKDWQTADAIRDQLQEMGIMLEDTPLGVRWRKK